MKITKYYEQAPDFEGKFAGIEVTIVLLDGRELKEVVLYPLENCLRYQYFETGKFHLYALQDPLESIMIEIPHLRNNLIHTFGTLSGYVYEPSNVLSYRIEKCIKEVIDRDCNQSI